MEWLKCETKEELKSKYKTLDKLRKSIKKDCVSMFSEYKSKDKNVTEIFKITSGSWDGITDKIKIFKSVIKNLDISLSSDIKVECVRGCVGENLFASEEAKVIFYLLETDGPLRAKGLNITKSQYGNKKAAKKWRDDIAKKIHPDICKIKDANKAVIKLNQLYEEMVSI